MEACAAHARDSRDRFREIEVRAACAVALLPFAAEPKVAEYLATCCAEITTLVDHAICEVVEDIDGYHYALGSKPNQALELGQLS